MEPQNQTPQPIGPNNQPQYNPNQTPYQQQANNYQQPFNVVYPNNQTNSYSNQPVQPINPNPSLGYTPPTSPAGPAVAVPQNMMPPEPPKKKTKLVFILVILTLLVLIFAVLTFVFYTQMTDYKLNSDKKSEQAVEQAKAEQEKQLNEQFAEKEKEPLKSYTGPANAAAVKIVYPKTWSLYTVEGDNGDTLNSYFNPNLVPNVANRDNLFALRLEVLKQPYNNVLRQYESKVTKGEVKVSPYVASNVQGSETGLRLDGAITDTTNGAMVIIPVRDKTIKIWTESGNFNSDFDNFVLKNLTFNP